jgi:Outer membrane protein beta-barrel domain
LNPPGKFYLPGGFNLQLGPQFGFLTGADSDYDPVSGTPSGADLEDYYKNSDVSLGMGIGWDLPMKITIDARYNLGLTDIDDNGSLEATKNQVFQISLGYKLFKFGK